MKKALLLLLIALFPGLVQAQAVKYDFDEVEVSYAAQFTARPQGSAGGWAARLAGDGDKPLQVLYGVVKLKKAGQVAFSEEFIKVTGEGGSVRLLVNSARFAYYPGTAQFQDINSFFWSAKKIQDATVVKDFTPPITSITLLRKFDEGQKLYAILLSFSDDGQRAQEEFWATDPKENLYKADLSTLVQAGDEKASSTGAPMPTLGATPLPTPPTPPPPTPTPEK